ncbi:SMI1/KNR4 family protein [Paenibacillus sp. YPG26]|uniref:SMI1/KNR4 family protein n=1 Tax=Paenibacillus sp. YPG26 TaxID=2878915 RepID=UPI002042064D|nr:SMI1/KNR4 family protein [Paenibacillus sp. YPG26]USB33392.1 SMI1/KNR4 family protein [Paenibacillus sp. YPG26]
MINSAELLWRNIITKGTRSNEHFKDQLCLQPGASDEDFQLIETTMDITIPKEMKEFYKIYNGQEWKIGGECFARNLTLSPIRKIIDDWLFLQEEFEPDDLEPEIDREIKPYLWNPRWIPIADNGAGDYLCLDTDPSDVGRIGQVLYFWHDWGQRSVEAQSFFEFLQICLEEDDN